MTTKLHQLMSSIGDPIGGNGNSVFLVPALVVVLLLARRIDLSCVLLGLFAALSVASFLVLPSDWTDRPGQSVSGESMFSTPKPVAK